MDLLDGRLVGQLVERAGASGLELTGESELLQQLTKHVLESAPGVRSPIISSTTDWNDPAGAGSGNSRNGSRAKTLLTDVGPGGDRGAAGPGERLRAADRQKRQRRCIGVDEMVLSLSGPGSDPRRHFRPLDP